MNNDGKIGSREALTLLIIIMTGKIFLSFPRDMVLLGQTAGWFLVILAGLVSLIAFAFLSNLLKRFPGKNLLQISTEIFGMVLGNVFNCILFFFFLIITALFFRQFAESFIISILPHTPISVISLGFMFILVYSCHLGIEAISRLAQFYGPFVLLALIFIFGFSLKNADFQQLAPVFGPGILPLLKETLPQTSIFSEILLLGIIAPLIREKNKLFKIGITSLLISIVISTLVTALVTLVYNYESANKLLFPIFQLARLVSIERFAQRTEAFFVFLWFFIAGLNLSGLFYSAVTRFAQTFRIKNYQPLIIPLGLLVYTISLIPSNMTQSVDFNSFKMNNYYALIFLGIPLILWLGALILRKGIRSKS